MSVGSVEVELQTLPRRRPRRARHHERHVYGRFCSLESGYAPPIRWCRSRAKASGSCAPAPSRSSQIVWAKFLNALPAMLLLGVGLGWAAAALLDLSPDPRVCLAHRRPQCGAGDDGVWGSAWVRPFHVSTRPIPPKCRSPLGGLLYMTLSLGYAALLTVILARPAWQTLRPRGGGFYWALPEGQWLLAGLAVLTVLVTLLTLLFGARRLHGTNLGVKFYMRFQSASPGRSSPAAARLSAVSAGRLNR